MIADFQNEPFTNFNDPRENAAFTAALQKVGRQLGRRYPIVLGGRRIRETKEDLVSTNPANHKEVVGIVPKGTRDLALKAVEVASQAFEDWKFAPARERADVLFRAARILRERKFEMAAWMVHEVGKSWVEAEVDTAEAIDFLEFYGRQAIRLSQPQPLTPQPGEDNELKYIPMGVVAVIPPWNFPLAIMAGMTVAAVAAGNTVVLKPSSDAPIIAAKFFEILEEAGLPDGVVNFLPGPGAAVGDTIVEHPLTRIVAFTGSKQVGLGIAEKCGRIFPGQVWIKRAVLEMGGKDFTPEGLTGATVALQTNGTQKVTLTSDGFGSYSRSSNSDATLTYQNGATYDFIAERGGQKFVGQVKDAPAKENIPALHPSAGVVRMAANMELAFDRADPPSGQERTLGFVTVVPVSDSGQQGEPTYTNVPKTPLDFLKLVAAPVDWKVKRVTIPGSAFPMPKQTYMVIFQSVRSGGAESDNLFLGSALLAGTADVGVVRTQ